MTLKEGRILCQKLYDHFGIDWFKEEDAVAFIGDDGPELMEHLHADKITDWQLQAWHSRELLIIRYIK